ncbi:plexin domain-containing protein 1-like [Sinocyclocheilus anshuiensis]|uniref:plexin domain-containing protein 1-like n=1 Tax=Sinocyclocheilus anshuiensis TaxID=1608454 RepID=UPI0007B9B5F2|nr:PREDICTED: plexin domain-containing protein 1-like [Sinocyclocheilus anshuiensis]
MGLCAVLLICLSQAELTRVWAQEQKGIIHGQSVKTNGGPSDIQRTRRDQQDPSRRTLNRTGQEPTNRLSIDMLPDNMTRVVEDSQRYYSWRSFGPGDKRTQDLWVDLDSVHQGPVRVHAILSNTHRQASRLALTFDFLFYGHQVRQITIATGGIVYRLCSPLSYIRPSGAYQTGLCLP